MKRLLMALAPLTFCSLLLTSCGEPEKIAVHIPTPPERLVCEAAGERPAVPAEHVIDWSTVTTVDQARAEHAKYVTSIRNREGIVTAYILRIEGKLFTCHTNMEWRRQYERDLSNP